MGFYVANLGCNRLILGHPWFRTFNPTIDWTSNTLTGETIHIETTAYRDTTELNAIQPPLASFLLRFGGRNCPTWTTWGSSVFYDLERRTQR